MRANRLPAPAPDAGELLEALDTFHREVMGELRDIRQLLERDRGPRDQADVALFMVIAEVIGDRKFTAVEILAHCRASSELRDAIEASDVTSPRELGKLCRRVERMPVAGLRLERVGNCRDGVVWRLRVHESHTRPD